MKKIILITWIVALILLAPIAMAGFYGILHYGLGLFGFGDITPPAINITKLAPTSVGGVTLAGTFSEDDTLANITIEFNSSYKLNASFNTASKTWSADANLSEGWNKFYIIAYDAAGNSVNATSSSQGASVLLDTTKPSVSLTALQNGSSVANNSLITFKISDLYLTDAFYTINSGATKSFHSIYELKAGTSEWNDGDNDITVNATDFTGNVERKSFTFRYSNGYSIVLNNSIITTQDVINDTNSTLNSIQDSSALQSLIDNFAAAIPVKDYNNTLQSLNVVANLSNAVSSMQSLLQDISSANSSSQSDAAKTDTINAKLDVISAIKNTTISSVDVNLFNPNLTVTVKDSTKNNVTSQLIAAVAGLSAANRQSFKDASAELQDKTTITNKVQTLTKIFLNGRAENVTLFEKNVSVSEAQAGQFYVNEFIDKNITGNNDLNANTDLTNTVSEPMTVVVADPTVSWTFSNAAGAVIGYTINGNVPSDNLAGSETVITTVPTATAGAGSSESTGGGGDGSLGSGSGGGGGIAAAANTDFTIDKTDLKIILKQGETKNETIRLKNIGTSIFDIKMDLTSIAKFKLFPEENEIITTLNPGEEKDVHIVYKAMQDETPDIYPFRIKLKSPSKEKEIAHTIEVDSARALFDVNVNVLSSSKIISPGQEVLIETNLINVRGFGRVDVKIEYAIKDLDGNVVSASHETLAAETQSKFTRSLSTPSDLKPGSYAATAKVIYEDSVGTGSDLFEVRAKEIKLYPIKLTDYNTIAMIAAAILLLGGFIFGAYKYGHSKNKQPKTEVEEIKQIHEDIKSEKLQKELAALEEAHKSGFISEESYQESKKRVEEALRKLK